MTQPSSNINDQRHHSKTSIAAAKEQTAIKFAIWKYKHYFEFI